MSRFLPIETESAALLAAKLTAQLAVSQRTVATAESCTGGLLGQLITSVPGSSVLYPGGVISYANQAKVELLGVQQSTLFHYGAVSSETVMEMARGVRQRLQSDWAIAVSGIAGPSGGTEEKPVGLVYIAWLGPTGMLVKRAMYRGDRTAVRLATAIDALGILIKLDRRVQLSP